MTDTPDDDLERNRGGQQWAALDLVVLADLVANRPELDGIGMTPILEGMTA